MSDHVLVCVRHIRNAKQLIEKGSKLAKAFGGKCYVLKVEVNPFDEFNFTSVQHKEELEKISKEFNAELLLIPSGKKDLADIISETAVKKEIKEIVIGQPVRTKLDIVMKGSLVSDLFVRLDGVDIYIVEIKKENSPEEEQYHRGVKGYIIKNENGFELSYDDKGEVVLEGIYFNSVTTQFTNGIFKTIKGEHSLLLKVHDGKVDINDISIF